MTWMGRYFKETLFQKIKLIPDLLFKTLFMHGYVHCAVALHHRPLCFKMNSYE